MNIIKGLKNLGLVLFVSLAMVACEEAKEHEEHTTTEEETTNMDEQMKVVQPVVDSAYDAAAEGDSTMLKDENSAE